MRTVAVFVVSTVALLPCSSPCADSTPKSRESEKAKPAGQAQSSTGCIDERDAGKYMLVDPGKLEPIAQLEADGFPNEGFAKYLGHKVVVKGIESSQGGRSVIKVRSIVTVSETCAPTPTSK